MNSNTINWRQLALELVVIFFGVTLAFFIENFREQVNELEEFDLALDGLIFEMGYLGERGVFHADSIDARVSSWEESDRDGKQAVPGYYRLPGSPMPPSAAWQSLVASGMTRYIPPDLRLQIGYFYNEFVGIHGNYLRYAEITENVILPLSLLGPDAFYDGTGTLKPEFAIHMRLQGEYAGDIRALTEKGRILVEMLHELRAGSYAENSAAEQFIVNPES